MAALLALLALTPAWNPFEAWQMRAFAEQFASPGYVVLDVGGRVIQGGARNYFELLNCTFVSMDIQKDRSVDIVNPPGEAFPFEDGHFDIVITTSTFEHDPMFWLTFREMARVTRVGGLILATSPHGGHYHRYPGDNYRFMQDAGAALAFWAGKEWQGHAYPIALNATLAGLGGTMPEMLMRWHRTTIPATCLLYTSPSPRD